MALRNADLKIDIGKQASEQASDPRIEPSQNSESLETDPIEDFFSSLLKAYDSRLRIEVMTLADTTKLILDQVSEDWSEKLEVFQGLFAATGRFYSGVMEFKKGKFFAIATTIENLRAELDRVYAVSHLSGRQLKKTGEHPLNSCACVKHQR